MARPRRNAVYRRAPQCRYCEQHTATFFARSGPGRVWYLCGDQNCRESIERQLVLEGIDPSPSETWEGREWLRLRRRFGTARVLRHAHAIARALSSLSARRR